MMIEGCCPGHSMVSGEGLGLICGVGDQGEQWCVGKRGAGRGEGNSKVRGLDGVIRIEDQGGG